VIVTGVGILGGGGGVIVAVFPGGRFGGFGGPQTGTPVGTETVRIIGGCLGGFLRGD